MMEARQELQGMPPSDAIPAIKEDPMPQFCRLLKVSLPGESYDQAVELAHITARSWDALEAVESAYFLADPDAKEFALVVLFATREGLDATRAGAREQLELLCQLLKGTPDSMPEFEVLDQVRGRAERARRTPQEGDGMATTVENPQLMSEALRSFSAAIDSHDVDAVMAAMTDDCVWESNAPAPDGERAVGQTAVRALFEAMFQAYPSGKFEREEVIVTGDRAVSRWKAIWQGGHVRGIDLFKVRDGKIAEKLSYIKGDLLE